MNRTQIRISALTEGSNTLEMSLDERDLTITPEEGVRFAGTVSVRGEIVELEGSLDLRGSLSGTLLATCARCAAETRAALEVPFRLIAMERPDDLRARVVEDEDLVYHDGHVLDIGDALRQLVLVSVPMAPLCREDCKGLCQVCGADRNESACTCTVDVPDPRWHVIDELLKRERED